MDASFLAVISLAGLALVYFGYCHNEGKIEVEPTKANRIVDQMKDEDPDDAHSVKEKLARRTPTPQE